jgi:crotonobetainyl-CoA:carnitine CoA-transferase CaiB-like acyl-CoA transferase
MAIGSDVQWRRLTERPKFASLATEERVTNEGRIRGRVKLQKDIASLTAKMDGEEVIAELRAASIPHSRINGVAAVRELEALRRRLTVTTTPEGKRVRMQPMAVDVAGAAREAPFSPKYGELCVPCCARQASPTTNAARWRRRERSGLSVWSGGFRPFFLGAAAYAL